MKLVLFESSEYYKDKYPKECYDYIIFRTKHFRFSWFREFGEWFIYIILGNDFWRFSSCGFIKGKNKDKKYERQ